jgi:hypothetical protein
MDMNRAKLAQLGVDSATSDKLFANPYYTPLDVTAMVEALSGMGGVENLDAMVARAASADSRGTAYFIRRRFELAADYQRGSRPIVRIARPEDLKYPLYLTKGGGAAGAYPIDILSWTPDTAATFEAMTAAAKADGAAGPKLLIITGTATPLARASLAALGWSVKENAK